MEAPEFARQIARSLLEAGAVKLSLDTPFTWASGWRSPIYCDNRVTLAYPHIRTHIRDGLVTAARAHFPQVEVIAGVATAGIPQGALVAQELGLPFAYVRPKPKEHGKGQQIEGHIAQGQNVLVIEDLVSTGGSSLKAIQALRDAGAQVAGLLCTFTYGFPHSIAAFTTVEVPFFALSDYEALLEEGERQGLVLTEQLQVLSAWRSSPETW